MHSTFSVCECVGGGFDFFSFLLKNSFPVEMLSNLDTGSYNRLVAVCLNTLT